MPSLKDAVVTQPMPILARADTPKALVRALGESCAALAKPSGTPDRSEEMAVRSKPMALVMSQETPPRIDFVWLAS